MFLDKRRFGEDNVVRIDTGEVLILPSYDPDNPYPFYQSEYFPFREDNFDYYDPISGQIILMDGMVSGESRSSQAISQGIITQPEIDWIASHSKWIFYGLIGIGILMILRPRRKEIIEVESGAIEEG